MALMQSPGLLLASKVVLMAATVYSIVLAPLKIGRKSEQTTMAEAVRPQAESQVPLQATTGCLNSLQPTTASQKRVAAAAIANSRYDVPGVTAGASRRKE